MAVYFQLWAAYYRAPSTNNLCHTSICTALIHSSRKAFWIILIVSVEECSNLTQNLMQMHCSTCSVILNKDSHPCSLNGISSPHWLVQWSRHCSHMRIPVHFPWLPGYIDVAQTVLIILTMAGLFLDRPHSYHMCQQFYSDYWKYMFI